MTVSTDSRPPVSVIGDRYRVIEVLGRGGMGVVYRVHDPSSGRSLALKQALPQRTAAESSQAVAALEREFYLLTQLVHPRVVEVYDYGIDRTGPFYTMELLDSGDLKALAPLDVTRACALMLDVCSSLALLHARRLVHRDVSARNVRCARDGHAKLIDFGAVVPMGPCTHTVGTPGFVAPEVVHHSNLDARTDLFSLGATLYYALTGRQPFAARTFSQLRDCWASELVLPSRLAPSIPPALDALCAALLGIDPGERPRSVYEVMQRLQAIAGITHDEPESVSQAYLVTPALVGREPQLRRFRQRMRNALHAQGGTVRFESAAGVGRTRLLDACVLEAKTLGAITLRATASAGTSKRFGVIQQLLEQLLQALPEASDTLEATLGFADPQALQDASLDRDRLPAALDRLFVQICESHALLIAIDDVDRVDEFSLGLLASLALQNKQARRLLVVTCDELAHELAPEAFSVLARQCSVEMLAALNREETRALLASVFGNSLYRQTLSDRLFEISLGVPGETLALTQHLIDNDAIRYQDGQWSLPRELDANQLPARATDVFAERIAALPPLARRIAEAQALLGSVLRHEDYALLAPEVSAAARDEAVLSLQTCGIVQYDGEFYNLRDRTLTKLLCDLLGPEQRRARHLTLHALYRAQPDAHPYLIVHHLLEAGQHERALDLLAKSDEGSTEQRNLEAALRAGPKRLTTILERALELSRQLDRPAREAHELRRRLCALSIIAPDANWFERIAPTWLEQLERDSGLADYRALDPTLDPSARLQTALQLSAARYDAGAERARVYRVDEAIKYLGLYVLCASSHTARDYDLHTGKKLSHLLEPFTALSPALAVLWQASRAAHAFFQRRVQVAGRAAIEVCARLATLPDDSLRFMSGLRASTLHLLALNDAILGRVSALDWVDKLEASTTLEIDVLHQRALAHLMLGDTERAEHFTNQAQLRALSTSRLRITHTGWTHEIHASVYLRDLVGLRRVIDNISVSARTRPGWRPQMQVAVGYFELLRGDLNAARAAFEQARSLAFPADESEPLWVDEFGLAVSGLVAVATERNEIARALALGEPELRRCQALGAEPATFHIGTALALALAKQGDAARASAHIDAVIAEQRKLDAGGIVLAHSYAVRATIALSANDSAAAERYIALTLEQSGGHKVLAAAAQREPRLLRARPTGSEHAHNAPIESMQRLRTDDPEASRVRNALGHCHDKPSRAARSLELLCALTGAASGHFYLIEHDQNLTHVAARNAKPPDADARLFAQRYFTQQLDDEGFAGLTQNTHMTVLPGAANYIDPSGREHQLLTLTCKDEHGLAYVGLAVLGQSSAQMPRGIAPQLLTQLSVLAALLLRAGDSPGARPSGEDEDCW